MKERVHLMAVFVFVVAEEGEGEEAEEMVLFQLIRRMEVGIVIGEILGAGVEEEDAAASVVVEGEVTMGLRLICSMMTDTTKMDLFKALVVAEAEDIVGWVVAIDSMGRSRQLHGMRQSGGCLECSAIVAMFYLTFVPHFLPISPSSSSVRP